ncbi:hypothetical protein D7Y13_16275 [Corallococcus praedator]|uniref:Uncharacterized protein n=1 Tax=Corallococcus praedator TaxID=2316724 RepID=A0ABX9QIJ9_9BACT|nr:MULTISPECIES: hypothetical protein [Corallococcus]RKI08284.1 hypothetical protein D7Y13_16275 [Corallococcus praedator]
MGAKELVLGDGGLEGLRECLLIAYALNRESHEFVVVSDYWEGRAAERRSFVRLVFEGVEDFKREPGLNPELRAFWGEYRMEGAPGGVVFQSVETHPEGGGTRANLWFGPSFGGCSFLYRGVHASVRKARVTMRGRDWEYRDAEDDEVLEFHEPFGKGAQG